jgi:hypothetical protein
MAAPFLGWLQRHEAKPAVDRQLHPDTRDRQIPRRTFEHSFDTIERAVFGRPVLNRIDRVSQSPDRSAQVEPVLQLKSCSRK